MVIYEVSAGCEILTFSTASAFSCCNVSLVVLSLQNWLSRVLVHLFLFFIFLEGKGIKCRVSYVLGKYD